MTDVKLHVGYVGLTRDGNRVDVTEHINAGRAGEYFVLSNGECVWPNGLSNKRETNRTDIIGPWTEPATEYPVGQWIGWNGGECPVHPETKVEVVPHSGMRVNLIASSVSWSGDFHIVAFRIVTPYVEPKPPREWLISMDTMHVQSVPSGFKPDGSATSYVHVREVMEADQ